MPGGAHLSRSLTTTSFSPARTTVMVCASVAKTVCRDVRIQDARELGKDRLVLVGRSHSRESESISRGPGTPGLDARQELIRYRRYGKRNGQRGTG